MPKAFDSTIRFLQTIAPQSWATLLGLKASKVTLCNTDLSTVSSAADFIMLLELDGTSGEHVESQASYEAAMGERTLFYNVLARKSLGVPIHSTVLLLRPEADGPVMNGVLRQNGRSGIMNLEFHFDVIRIWTIPAERLIECGLGVLPFAFIGAITPQELPALVRQTEALLDHETKPGLAAEIWTSIRILMGLRFKDEFVNGLLKGVKAMKESTTYQAIVEEGREMGRAEGAVKEARAIILRLATLRFGAPDAQKISTLNSITSLERLDIVADRVMYVSNWDELLAP
jgi:hypothetical protein